MGRSLNDVIAGLPLDVNFAPDWMELLIAHLAKDAAAPARTSRPVPRR